MVYVMVASFDLCNVLYNNKFNFTFIEKSW